MINRVSVFILSFRKYYYWCGSFKRNKYSFISVLFIHKINLILYYPLKLLIKSYFVYNNGLFIFIALYNKNWLKFTDINWSVFTMLKYIWMRKLIELNLFYFSAYPFLFFLKSLASIFSQTFSFRFHLNLEKFLAIFSFFVDEYICFKFITEKTG